MIDERIDRTKITSTSLDEPDADDIEYCMSRTATDRLEGIEHLRRWLYGEAAVDQGLQRVLTSVELEAD